MSTTEPVEVALRITAALDYVRSSNDDELRPHYLQEVQQITDVVSLSDLTTAELASLTALLIPAHSRILAGHPRPDAAPPVARLLHLVGGDQSTAG